MKKIHDQVSNYYSQKLAEHGSNHAGVDWNSTESQYLRFRQLLRLHNDQQLPFSILDFGCGYGALVDYLQQSFNDFSYIGYDIAPTMVEAAQAIYPTYQFTSTLPTGNHKSDYVVASGIFNVRLQTPDSEWLDYILQTLHQMWDFASKGIAFNSLTSYSDAEYMRDYLYYANPTFLFDYCKKNFSRQVALLHDYGLYEFTILVRKEV